MNFRIEIAASSDKGLVRTNNEDMALANRKLIRDSEWSESVIIENSAVFFAVADGLGGHKYGEIASSFVLNSLMSFENSFFKDGTNIVDFLTFKKTYDNFLKDVHANLVEYGNNNTQMKGLGTTLTGLLITPLYISLFNSGDSRVYRFRGGFLNQLTSDHSLKSETGFDKIPRNIITNCIGGGVSHMFVDIENVTDKIKKDDILLICSDGLYDMASHDAMENILSKDITLIEKCSGLINSAKQGGGNDNITVILCLIK